MKRRDFIKASAIGAIGVNLLPLSLHQSNRLKAQTTAPDVVWVENGEPEALFKSAMKELGGINKFISKGDVVVIKPNIGWAKTPEFAATTNPDLVAEIVKQCKEAGAKEVKVFDHTCNPWQRCYNLSGIEEKAGASGAKLTQTYDHKYTNLAINGQHIKEWPIYKDYLEADKVINVPIAKHHGLDRVTLGLKNLMGVMGGRRGSLHNNFGNKMADINSKLIPTLTIIDAYRILTANGPTGGNLSDVKLTKTLIASSCTVSADYVALDLFGHKLHQIQHISIANERGLNKFDLTKLNVKKVKLA
ncbi:MAG: DUF362 domain-containing protein [Calditrichaceae bacterium]|nr:DUF362 domain-containing protein [Calditrichaceae bacterium]